MCRLNSENAHLRKRPRKYFKSSFNDEKWNSKTMFKIAKFRKFRLVMRLISDVAVLSAWAWLSWCKCACVTCLEDQPSACEVERIFELKSVHLKWIKIFGIILLMILLNLKIYLQWISDSGFDPSHSVYVLTLLLPWKYGNLVLFCDSRNDSLPVL